MSRTKHALAAAVAAVFVESSAHASISFAGLSAVPITAAALAADPSLANYTSYDLLISISAGDSFAAASLQGTLHGSMGSPVAAFYIPPLYNSDTGMQAMAAYVPNLAYDTFISWPGYVNLGDSYVTGSASGAAQATFPGSPNPNRIPTANKIDIAWYGPATANTLSGIQAITRLTVSNNADLFNSPFTGVIRDPSTSVNFAFGPEPAGAALVSLGLGAVVLRRRHLPISAI